MIKIFLIDDEQLCIDDLAWQLSRYKDIDILGQFTNPLEAFKAIENHCPDVVFLDVDMPRMGGLDLAQKIQTQYMGIIIIFVTGYEKYALEAYKSFPLDFLVKPVLEARLDETIKHLRRQHSLLHPAEENHVCIKIKCFGFFEIISESKAKFPTHRVQELLLYLIDRHGVAVTRDEILEALFEGQSDRNTVNNLYVTLSRLRTLLDCWDEKRTALRLTDNNALIIEPGVCDYTDFMTFARQNASISGKNAVEAARVLSLCDKPYLEKETFEWAVDSAYDVENEYERIALGLSVYYISENRLSEAESVLCSLLARNPLSTDGYTALLNLYIRSHNKSSYIARYEEYARVLKNELRLRPEEVYRNYYTGLKPL